MPKTRPAYPEEFRSEVVQMVRSGRSAGDVARTLGCSEQSVTNWVRRYERDQGIRKDGLNTAEREELKKLRREEAGERSTQTSRGLLRGRPMSEKFRLVEAEKAWKTPVKVSCDLLGVSRSATTIGSEEFPAGMS